MIVARSLSPAEPDLMEGRTLALLRILSLEGVEVVQYHAPQRRLDARCAGVCRLFLGES
ncbi:hypothetical protein VCRA2128O305_170121 [Vibrio crassostreae]|nr:hypothetical protein VCRA2116O233_150120 [Vibrio crassostreae]CAK1785378.1 hypothetical protein VCRA2113O206_170013 [Vibrio crassostreae]CAK1789992.1 hypothetical protein VCRA2110O175_170013 [Vibrio crassostreae]CAK2601257.1 hypothetical protein VCRA2119O244_160111 [Vibrio crassostreae]CAK2711997.1 hypothetical protein VCRA2127O303_150007 [Vibrio crassostreae]